VSPLSAPQEIRAWIDALKRIQRTSTPPDSRPRATVNDAIVEVRSWLADSERRVRDD
jgi:hypothetical protein